MAILEKLHPAEAKLILDTNVGINKLGPLILQSLVQRQILSLSSDGTTIKAGSEINNAKVRSYEQVFVASFLSDSGIVLNPKLYFKDIKKTYRNSYDLRRQMRRNYHLESYFSYSLMTFFFSATSLSSAGRSAKTLLQKELQAWEDSLSLLLSQSPEKCLEALQKLGVHVFLLSEEIQKSLRESHPQFKNIEALETSAKNSTPSSDVYYQENDWLDYLWYDSYEDLMFDGIVDAFPKGTGGFWESSGSGCGGDASGCGGDSGGCSGGCSGCGGCGGCGG